MTHSSSDSVGFKQQFEAGSALCLICLIGYFVTDHRYFLYALLVVLLVMMSVRTALTPVAIGWFKLADVMSRIMSKVVLGFIYILVITPIGWVRRIIFRKDPMMRRSWKIAPTGFTTRNQRYQRSDLEHPF
ncbi:hypothetical protein EBR57_08150 [bacterium]|nr:hypothetical protein [bacterium]